MASPNELPARAPSPAPAALSSDALSRGALERVLARAAQLQVGAADAADGLTEAQLVSIAQEVGIVPEALKQALAEERTRSVALPTSSARGGMFGPEAIETTRVVPGSPDNVLRRIDEWMQQRELLRERRRLPNRLTWERRRDLLSEVQSSFNLSGRSLALKRADEVGATVTALDDQRTLVRLDAGFAEARRKLALGSGLGGGAVMLIALGLVGFVAMVGGGFGIAEVGILAVMASIGVGIVGLAARAMRRRIERAQVALEQVLDRLEHGAATPSGNPITDLLSSLSR